jgi:integrase
LTLLENNNQKQHKQIIISPYERFFLALKSSESKIQYPNRLQRFLEFLQIEGSTIDEKCLNLYNNLLKGKTSEEIEDLIFKFIIFQKERIARNEIGPGTLTNYMKSIKLFCKMNRINVFWDIVKTIIPSDNSNGASDDRIPTIYEIQKLIEYPDRRIKTIVLIMLSSGIRLGAWDYLKWKHIIPIEKEVEGKKIDVLVAAKIIVYAGDDEEYFSYITPEAYNSLKEWMDFRASYGEQITPDSWLMRNTWKKVNVKQGNRTGLAKKPIKFKGSGIRILMGRAWNIQNVRGILEKGEKRHEFKSTHGFRKFFKSTCEHSGMKSLHVEMLMGHSIGLAKNYYRPNENEILEDYLKSVPFLTINDEYRLSKQVEELKEKNQDSEYVIKGKLQEKEEQIKKLEESVAFLSDKFNAFLISQPGNNIIYHEDEEYGKNNVGTVKGIELKPEINNKIKGKVIPSNTSFVTKNKKK